VEIRRSGTVPSAGGSRTAAPTAKTGLASRAESPDVATRLPTPSVPEADHTTRQRVVRSILEHGPSTAGQLAERLALTPAAVRRHLASLEDSGDLTSAEEKVYGTRGRGRPARTYSLTDAGRARFPSAYDELAIQALRQLRDTGGHKAVERFAQERVRDVVDRFWGILDTAEAAGEEVDPAEALTRALNEHGYVASTLPALSGEQLCQHHCPVAHVAEEFPELCSAETEVFSQILGIHVQRLATIADGNGVCTTHIPDRQGHIPDRQGHIPDRQGHIPDRTGHPPDRSAVRADRVPTPRKADS